MKKITHSFTKKELRLAQAALAVIALSILSPLATPASLQGQVSSAQVTRAINDVSRVRRQNQRYWDAVQVYRDLVREGVIEAHQLDIMQPETYEKYLDQAYVNLLLATDGHQSAFEETNSALDEYEILPERYQRLLDGFRYQVGFCPERLQQYHLAGFYDLCVRLIDETLQGTLVDQRKPAAHMDVRSATLKDRLEMFGDITKEKLYEDGQNAQ